MGRRSLLIGCATGKLKGIANDLDSMAAVLDQYGFASPERIDGQEATRAAILARLDVFIDNTRPEDAALIYYSGHGGCLPWQPYCSEIYPNEALEPGLNATRPRHYQFLVPVDIAESSPGDFRGIADIELAYKLAILTAKTPNVIVVLDCCFAEGVMRSADESRMAGWITSRGLSRREMRWLSGLARLGDRLQASMENGPALHPEANQRAVILSAASPEQQASERAIGAGPVRGIMTHALVAALDECRGRRVSWRALHHRVCAEVLAATAGSQHPQISGPSDRVLFGLEPAPAVAAIRLMYEGAQPYLSAGELAGVAAGDRFAILPATAEHSDQAVATATVTFVKPERALVRIEAATGSPGTAAAAVQVPAGSWAHPLHSMQRALIARSLRSGSGQHALDIEIAAAWGLAVDGVPKHRGMLKPVQPEGSAETRAQAGADFQEAQPAVLACGSRIYFELQNCDGSRSTYWSVLSVDVDGEVELCTTSHSMGIEIAGGDTRIIGARPQERLTGLALEWPQDAPDELAGLRSFLIVAMDQAYDLSALTRARLDGYGIAPPADELFVRAKKTVTRSIKRPAPAPLRYAIFRLDLLVLRG